MRVNYHQLIKDKEYRIVVKYNDCHIPIECSYEFEGKFVKRVYDESCGQVIFIDNYDNQPTWVSILNEFYAL